jgi:putative flippase GtrA
VARFYLGAYLLIIGGFAVAAAMLLVAAGVIWAPSTAAIIFSLAVSTTALLYRARVSHVRAERAAHAWILKRTSTESDRFDVHLRSHDIVSSGPHATGDGGSADRKPDGSRRTPPAHTTRDLVRGLWRILLKEVFAFGVVGSIALALDVGIFVALAQYGAIKAKLVSGVISTAFAYFGNRYFSFSHRARVSLGREASFFLGVNALALVWCELVIALFVYGFGARSTSGTVLAANLCATGLATGFRFWAYRRYVFMHPDRIHAADVDVDRELAE